MEIALIILAFFLLAAGLVGAVVPIIPGPPLSYFGLLVLHWSGRGGFSLIFLLTWAFISAGAIVMDYLLPSIMTKHFGGSRSASIGAFLGLIAGLFFVPVGLIIGPFLGALLGEIIHMRGYSDKALKVALGAFLSFIAGTGIKLTVSVMMLFFAIRTLI
ncbi:MAG: DUF456 domain-containing protein [Treponema sp.]|nr:DUF456 domain-containing protein [Treponema sp.]